MFLVRKINRDRWEPTEGFAAHEVPAELLRTEFNAKGNSLSLWTAANDQEVVEASLAIIAACARLETIDVVWFPVEALRQKNVAIEASDGHTKVQDLVKRHVDAARLDAFRLAEVAHLVAAAVADQRVRRITKNEAADLLLSAVDAKRLGITNLPKEVREEIEAARLRRTEAR